MDGVTGSKNYLQRILSRARGEVPASSLVRAGWQGIGSKVSVADPFEAVAGVESLAPETGRTQASPRPLEPAASAQPPAIASQPESRPSLEVVRREIRAYTREDLAPAGAVPEQNVSSATPPSPQVENSIATGLRETRPAAAPFRPSLEPATRTSPTDAPANPAALRPAQKAESNQNRVREENSPSREKPFEPADRKLRGETLAGVVREVRKPAVETDSKKAVEPEKRPTARATAPVAEVKSRMADQARPRMRMPYSRPAEPAMRPQPRPLSPRPAVEAGPRLTIGRMRVEIIPAPTPAQPARTTVIKRAPGRSSGNSRGTASPLRFGLGQL